MLKLKKKEPTGDGPHTFGDLYSTAVVENPDAFPWMRSGGNDHGLGGADDDDDIRGERDFDLQEDAGNDYSDQSGLPSHLDMNPAELFVQPDDNVVSGTGDLDFPMSYGDDFANNDDLPSLDLDLVDQPKT